MRQPSKQELEEAGHRKVRDLIAPDLQVLFCGINPGRYTAATGYHFAGPGNRFWPTMHAAGFTPRRLSPHEQGELLTLGFGITNLVDRPTARADLLGREEIIEGAGTLLRKVRRFRPRILAVVGLGAYRTAFAEPGATCGLQERAIGLTRIWLLPNPSGLNAHHPATALVELFRTLRHFASTL
jgi:TDG/mug DNA glycosylase family protein